MGILNTDSGHMYVILPSRDTKVCLKAGYCARRGIARKATIEAPVDDHITSPPMLTVSRYCMVSIWSLLNNLNLQHGFLASGLVACDAVCILYISSNSKNASMTRRATRVMSTLKTLGFEHSLQGCVECHWTVLIMMRS